MIGSEAADRIAAEVGRRAATVLTPTLFKPASLCPVGLPLELGIWPGRPQAFVAPDAYRGCEASGDHPNRIALSFCVHHDQQVAGKIHTERDKASLGFVC